MWMFLARTVFHLPLSELKQRLTEREFQQWITYYGISPWGDDWEQSAMTTAAIINAHGASIDPEELIPYADPDNTPAKRAKKERVKKLLKFMDKQKAQREKIRKRKERYSPCQSNTDSKQSSPKN